MLEIQCPSPYVGCIGGCDHQFLQLLNINRTTAPSQVSNNTVDSGIGRSMNSNSINTTNTSQRTIFRNNVSNPIQSSADIGNFTGLPQNDSSNHNGNATGRTWYSGTNNSSSISQRPVAQNTNGQWNMPSTQNRPPPNVSNTNGQWNSSSTQNRPTPNANMAQNGENDVVCNCGELATLLTVRKASPNMGSFYFISHIIFDKF